MSERPICAVEGCDRPALMLFAGKLVCGLCVAEYDRKMKANQFDRLQEVLNDNNDLS